MLNFFIFCVLNTEVYCSMILKEELVGKTTIKFEDGAEIEFEVQIIEYCGKERGLTITIKNVKGITDPHVLNLLTKTLNKWLGEMDICTIREILSASTFGTFETLKEFIDEVLYEDGS
jgi:hypothetical protein